MAPRHDDRLVTAADDEQLTLVHDPDVTGAEVAVVREAELRADVPGEQRRAAKLDRRELPVGSGHAHVDAVDRGTGRDERPGFAARSSGVIGGAGGSGATAHRA